MILLDIGVSLALFQLNLIFQNLLFLHGIDVILRVGLDFRITYITDV